MNSQDYIDENKKLKQLTNDIDNEINRYLDINKSMENDLDRSNVVDYDDADRYRHALSSFKSNNETIENLKEIRKSPYFGRLDLEDENGEEDKILYIGKEGLFINFVQRIIDWRSDLGDLFYRKDLSKEINVNNYTYKLILKREFDIKNTELLLCKTLYDAYDLGANGDIVDSFLIDVLKDKRRDKKVTDIIRTIQENQNEILRQPIDNNFVVQGCAGSGKTMILLHRLSYILYNNLIEPSEIRIITPNKYFDFQIDELSKELDIGSIKRMTVDEYYLYLLDKLNNVKINREIFPEYVLDEEYLKNIYSSQFVNAITNELADLTKELKNKLNSKDVYGIFSKANYMLPKNSSENLGNLLNSIDIRIDTIKKEFKARENIKKYENFNKEFENKTKNIVRDLIVDEKAKIDSLNNIIEQNKMNAKELQEENKFINKEIKDINSKKNMFDVNRDIVDFDYIIDNDNELTVFVREMCEEKINNILNIKKEYDSISVINFIRRNQLSLKINEEKINISNDIKAAYDLYCEEHITQNYEIELDDLNKTIKFNNQKISEYSNKNSLLKDDIELCENIYQEMLSIKKPIQLLEYLNKDENEKHKSIHNNLKSDYSKYQNNIDSIRKYNSEHEGKTIDVSNIMPDEIENLDLIEKEIVNYKFEIIESKLKEKYLKFTDRIYRHTLYFKLLFAYLYNGSNKINDKLICFDESQDLSPCEIQLFKNINNKKCIFNFYGDVNQAVYDHECIIDWKKELNFVDKLKVFELNQNYRNSYQITDYCNKVFNSNISPIGIKGENDVFDKLNFNQSLQNILNISSIDKQKRCVIIYSDKNNKTVEFMKNLTDEVGLQWNKIIEKGVSVMPVRLCKGLEFDAVLVMNYGMNEKEKYISYTRALDNLIICDANLD